MLTLTVLIVRHVKEQRICNNPRTEGELKDSIQCAVSSASPLEFRRATNSMFVGCGTRLRAKGNFPAPSLNVEIKNLILTEIF
jgi:hypothetical protein